MLNNSKLSGTQYIRTCDYIDEHLTHSLHISEIAESVELAVLFVVLFFQYHNCTINDYINNHRIEKAKFLLKSSTLSITDIAFFCGYNSRQHFRSTFCKFVEMNRKVPAFKSKFCESQHRLFQKAGRFPPELRLRDTALPNI